MNKEFETIILNDEIEIKGFCNTIKREELIENAISALQNNPDDWAKKMYYGIKNYASFGDQREDHEYGYGPRHGTIVFSIGRGKNFDPSKKDIYIEFLIFFRDFRNETLKVNRSGYNYLLDFNDLIKEKNTFEMRLTEINNLFDNNASQ